MVKEINRYRIVDTESKIIEENLSIEEANYLLDFLLSAHGISNLKIEEYFPREKSMGRDADLH